MSDRVRFVAMGVGARLAFLVKDMLERHGQECELVGMSDEAPAALTAAREVLGDGPRVFEDYRELLAGVEADWALIGSKNYLHCEHCLAAFARGMHVFCEKPLAISIEECEAIRDAHREAGTTFATGFVLRHAPMYRKVREILESGGIGKLVSMEANENLAPDHGAYIMRNWRRFRAQAGSHLLEKCCHDIDLLNWMAGSVASRVASFGGLDIFVPDNKEVADRLRKPEDDPPLYMSWGAWEDVDPFLSDKDIEDNRVSIIEYRNGVRATFHASACSAFPQRRMLLCGLEGTVEADLHAGSVRYQRVGRDTREEKVDLGALGGHGGADGILVDQVARCMTSGEAPEATGEHGFVSTVTCLAMDDAMLEGRVVDCEEYWERFGV